MKNLTDDVIVNTVLRGRLVQKIDGKVIEKNYSLINSKSQVGITFLKGVFQSSGKEFAKDLSEGVGKFITKEREQGKPFHSFNSA